MHGLSDAQNVALGCLKKLAEASAMGVSRFSSTMVAMKKAEEEVAGTTLGKFRIQKREPPEK